MLLLTVFFSASCTSIPHSDDQDQVSLDDKIRMVSQNVLNRALYFGVGATFGLASLITRLGWGICLISPWSATIGNECLLLSYLCESIAEQALTQEPPLSYRPSLASWHLNQKRLSQIPASSDEERELLHFLERRWLAKSTGFYPLVVDWICPSLGITVQVHPEATNSYARDPSNKISLTYTDRVESWKKILPHPDHFPLILTRPYNLQDYLPSYLGVPCDEKVQITVERAALKMEGTTSKVVIDLSDVFKDSQDWKAYQKSFSKGCKDHNLDPNRIICIERLKHASVGGIRLIPLDDLSPEEIELQHQFLLEWISKFGLSANRVELDRWDLSSSRIEQRDTQPAINALSKEDFLTYLSFFDQNWSSNHPQKNLLLKGTLQALQGLLTNITHKKWDEIRANPTRSSIVQLSFAQIKEQLELFKQKKDDASFFNTASHLEEVHASLSALLEIFAPFTSHDFPKIYQHLLTSIPENLTPLTSYGIHASGMTSLTGIFKAVERSLSETGGKPPRVLYGENTYFENILTAGWVASATSILDASEQDWEEADLILTQFNPALKRIDLQVSEYKVEKIAEYLHKALSNRGRKPLTMALDCTLDYINSPRVSQLLTEFQDEIKRGALNVICYRSGLKFDLFGMDNYCGAPFYMIHNQDPKWDAFNCLFTDPILQTDRLSLNWFCLAYQYAPSHLELYRQQIFRNTRDLLNRVPLRLLHDKNASYRIIPIEQAADAAFVDIKFFGSLHQVRGSLAGALLSLKCMEKKHPLFYRPSLGFYHPNCSLIMTDECSTIRLTLGLDPAQVGLLAECFEIIDSLNGAPWKTLTPVFRGSLPASSQ